MPSTWTAGNSSGIPISWLRSGPQLIVSTVSSSDVNCGDLVPEIGITGTPVIDTTTNTLYVSVETKEYNPQTQTKPSDHTLHALDIRTGLDKVPPHNITAVGARKRQRFSTASSPSIPLLANQRPSLLLADGQVFVSFSSHCDLGNYHGWLMSFNQTSLAATGFHRYTEWLRGRLLGRRFRAGGRCGWFNLYGDGQWVV
jgi:hypothetical protein